LFWCVDALSGFAPCASTPISCSYVSACAPSADRSTCTLASYASLRPITRNARSVALAASTWRGVTVRFWYGNALHPSIRVAMLWYSRERSE
jgi:hypothetical protein